MSETLDLDDFIVLGNAVPDELKDLRKTICYAGYSEKHGMIRIYPVPPNVKMPRWSKVEVILERNKKDVRKESWKVKGSKEEWPKLKEKFNVKNKVSRDKSIELLEKLYKEYGVDCIQDLNTKKLSLGFIKPRTYETYFKKRKNQEQTKQMMLFGKEPFWTIHNYGYQPRVKYTCQNCRVVREYHDQQIIEWGVYEWMRKYPNELDKVWENLHLNDPSYDTYLLVGNQARYLTSFMIISKLGFKKSI